MTDTEPDMEALMLADNPEFERVMECVFGLRAHETETYLVLATLPGSTATELATELERDRSTVQRTLSTLVEYQLAERDRRIVDGGGTVYQYFAKPIPEIQQRMRRTVDEWVEEVHNTIDSFGAYSE